MPSVPGMVEAEVLDPLCVLVSVAQNRLLGHGLVLLRDLHYEEIPHHFPRSYCLLGVVDLLAPQPRRLARFYQRTRSMLTS